MAARKKVAKKKVTKRAKRAKTASVSTLEAAIDKFASTMEAMIDEIVPGPDHGDPRWRVVSALEGLKNTLDDIEERVDPEYNFGR